MEVALPGFFQSGWHHLIPKVAQGRGLLIAKRMRKMEIPLADVDFDGNVLSFRMQGFKDLKSKEIITSPYKVALRVIDDDCFEGQHVSPDGSSMPRLMMLIRVKS